ncbi:hypothetical protein IR073_06460 [Gemella sp. 19428wG2_WT2a]|nr:hypothetical protein [Gemella sp. 19428wG2_WT2a]TFU57678.1 hypothetical protein E4T67_06385 [Gemella sp. WT2a]
MSTYDVTAILKANVTNFASGMKEAQTAIESLKSKSNRTFENVANSLGSAGMAMTGAFTAPAVAGVGAVIRSYADLEQAVGGVRTLFANEMGDASQTVIDNANRAYRTAGVSATKYMEQSTSMAGVLLQGLGGDAKQAAQYADQAIVQMSDNSNKMGTRLESLQQAYAGFSRGQFGLLDNLKLGYGGTQAEMARLINDTGVMGDGFKATAENVKDIPFHKLIEGIQKAQDKLGITGTTAKEASDTVSGSFIAMASAGKNLVAGLGDNEANISQLMSNMSETIGNFAKNIKRVLGNIWNNLPLAPWQKWLAAIAVGAGPIMLAISRIMKTVGSMSSVFKGIGAVLSNPFALAIIAIAALVAGLVYAYKHSETFRNIVNSAVSEVAAAFSKLKEIAQPAIDAIVNAFGKFNVGAFTPLIIGVGVAIAAFKRLKNLKVKAPIIPPPKFPKNPFSGMFALVKSFGASIKSVFVGLGQGIASVFKGIGTAVARAFTGLATVNPFTMLAFSAAILAVGAAITMVLTQAEGITAVFSGLSSVVMAVGSAIGGIATAVIGAFAQGLVTVAGVLPTVASSFAMLSPLVLAFGTAISQVIVAFSTLSPVITAAGTAISTVITAIANGASQIITTLTPIVGIIGEVFTSIVTTLANAAVQIVTALAPVLPAIMSSFQGIVTVVSNAIVQVVSAIAPFIPAITEMVSIVVSNLPSIISAFTELAGTIPGIINSITGTINSFKGVIESVFNGAKGVIESFGSAVSGILDSVSGVIRSIGESAEKAGNGFRLFSEGMQNLSNIGAGSIIATMASVAAGIALVSGKLGELTSISSAFVQLGSSMMSLTGVSMAFGMSMSMIGTAVSSVQSSITSLPAVFTTLQTSLMQIPTILTSVQTALTTFGTSVTTSMTSLTTVSPMVMQFTTALNMILPVLTTVSTAVTTFTVSVASSLTNLSSVGASISQFTSQIMTINTAVANAESGLSSFNSQVSGTMSSLSNLGSSAQSALSQIQVLGNGIATSMTTAATAVQNTANQISTSIQTTGTRMTTIMQATMSQIVSVVVSGMSSAGQAVLSGTSRMVSAMTSAGSRMVAVAQSTMNQIRSIFASGMSSIVSIVVNGGSQIVSAFRSAGSQMVSAAQSMVNQTAATIRSGYGAMVSAGRYIGEGVAAGMRSALGAVAAAANAIISKANEAARAAAKIHSPSRLFRDDVGYWLGAGVAVGVEESGKLLEKSFDFIKDTAKDFAIDTANIFEKGLNLANLESNLSRSLTVSHTPQSINHNIDNVVNQKNLVKQVEELVAETKKGHVIYMNDREVASIMDSRLGKNTVLGGRFSW